MRSRSKIAMSLPLAGCVLAGITLNLAPARAEIPPEIAISGETLVTIVRASGAQVYECTDDGAGGLAWKFREPIATLVHGGRTVGQHFAGPRWQMEDGSVVVGKVVGRAPGATAGDIPLLKLAVVSRNGGGLLADIATIQRLNTRGGHAEGECDEPRALLSVPYAADYAFYARDVEVRPHPMAGPYDYLFSVDDPLPAGRSVDQAATR